MFAGLQAKLGQTLTRLKIATGKISRSTPALDVTQEWNNANETFTAVKANVTDTSSAAASLLMDLQVGGTSKFKVDKTGAATFAGAVATTSTSGFQVSGNWAITGSNVVTVSISGGNYVSIDNGKGMIQRGDVPYSWSSTSSSTGSVDLSIARDAANTLAQRNSTNAQTFRLYNTYTDASNYERTALTWSSNVAYLRNQNAGTGSARLMVVVTGSTTVASLPSASTAGAGARAFVTDANATTFLSTVAGGGANAVPVVSDGTNWLIG